MRVRSTVKHVCVAARIGEGKAPGEGNSYSYCQDEQRCHRRFWLQPFGLARVFACSSRLSAKGFCLWAETGAVRRIGLPGATSRFPRTGLRLTSHGAASLKVPCLE